MRVILFGATGMVGQGVLRECLRDERVTGVLAVVRSPLATRDPKLREARPADFTDLSDVEDEFDGADACLFCLGVSSIGMAEDAYTRVTYDFTLAAADAVARQAPGATFVYVSGAGTDSIERGRSMWARVKGRTENALLAHADLDAYMLRPGFIQPLHGAASRTRWVRVTYAALRPVTGTVRRLFPRSMCTTEQLGRAMLRLATDGWPSRALATADIVAAAR